MGGFRFNGCGATDHFKKIKSLGIHTCPNCKTEAEFFLEECRFKVDVFFIPTVTLKKSYAIMCSKCKIGETCSEEWAIKLMRSKEPVSVIFESQEKSADTPLEDEINEAPIYDLPINNTSVSEMDIINKQVKQKPAYEEKKMPIFFKCPKCGVTQIQEGDVCSFCGNPIPEDVKPADNKLSDKTNKISDTNKIPENKVPDSKLASDVPDETIVCPSCGNIQKPGTKFCSECGHKIDVASIGKKFCPACGKEVRKGDSFCMECGTKL